MICAGCGFDVRFPTHVDGRPYHYLCARKVQGEPQDPVWLSRAKARPHGLAKDLTRV